MRDSQLDCHFWSLGITRQILTAMWCFVQESISEKELTKALATPEPADLGLFFWDVNLALEHSFYASWRRCDAPSRTFLDSRYTHTADLLALLEPVRCKVTTCFMFSIFFFCLNTSWSNLLPPYLFPFFHNLKVLIFVSNWKRRWACCISSTHRPWRWML